MSVPQLEEAPRRINQPLNRQTDVDALNKKLKAITTERD